MDLPLPVGDEVEGRGVHADSMCLSRDDRTEDHGTQDNEVHASLRNPSGRKVVVTKDRNGGR